jgi:3-oxoacyl-[acyl-carrier protein] reductase/bacilysin biosynthesis oxidoreductase BacG
MQLGLEGKVAIVTGGSKGIGRAIAYALLAEGASVLICSREQSNLDNAVAMAGNDAEGRIRAVAAELNEAEDIRRVVQNCVSAYGRVDILVNNAGSARLGNFLDMPLDDWRLKFLGYVRMAREVFPYMQAQGGGVIVNVIGAAAFNPEANYMIGGSANLALNHFTKALAKQGTPHNIRVIGVNPGPIATERLERRIETRPEGVSREEFLKAFTPLGRPGRPEEVADLITFLASERASFISGTNLTINGAANPSIMG